MLSLREDRLRALAVQLPVSEAVGVCQQCGEAVCVKHAVKADVPLPGNGNAEIEKAHPVLLPLLCADCYEEIKALSLTPA